MSATIQPVLPSAVGYAVVLGVGLGFAAMLAGLMWLQNRYSDIRSDNTAEFACECLSLIFQTVNSESTRAYSLTFPSQPPRLPSSLASLLQESVRHGLGQVGHLF